MIIVISDLHFGHDQCDLEAINHFICNYVQHKLRKNDHLILLGDILDFWRKTNIDILLNNEECLQNILDLNTNIHYIIGNHDFCLMDLSKRFENNQIDFQFHLRLQDRNKKFYFTHGYELDVIANYEPMSINEYENISRNLCGTTTFFGTILSKIWSTYRTIQKNPDKRYSLDREGITIEKNHHVDKIKELVTSQSRDFFLGLQKDEILVFGHTHNAFEGVTAVNTGSWLKDNTTYHPFLEIRNGSFKLKDYEF